VDGVVSDFGVARPCRSQAAPTEQSSPTPSLSPLFSFHAHHLTYSSTPRRLRLPESVISPTRDWIPRQNLLSNPATESSVSCGAHLTGRSCNMDAINAVAENNGLLVIEDAAHC
jgi:DegT/DnrJ/EryC1/StrS aminotransferase family